MGDSHMAPRCQRSATDEPRPAPTPFPAFGPIIGNLGTGRLFERNIGRHEGSIPDRGAWPGFVADAWLANWDAAAPGNPNERGAGYFLIDVGGSMDFRAFGQRKQFSIPIAELESMLDPTITPNAATLFAGIDCQALVDGGKAVEGVEPLTIRGLAADAGRSELADTVIARRDDIGRRILGVVA